MKKMINKTIITGGVFFVLLFVFSVQSFASLVITNGLTHEFSVSEGDTLTGAIIVSNTSEKPEAFIVFQRDYYINHAGESNYPEAGTTDRSNASWIDYSPDQYVLQPGESTNIDYRVIVPDTADLKGTYWSVILVEGTKMPMAMANQGIVTINSIIRYAVQVICNFEETGTRDIEFINVELKKVDERQMLDVDLINSGDFMLRPLVSIELFDEQGESIGIFNSTRRRVFPKTSRRFEIDLSGIKPGSFQSLLLADCSEENVFGTNLTLEIKDE